MAGSNEDQTSNESPVVFSSYTPQLELDCIGRHIKQYILCMRLVYSAKEKGSIKIRSKLKVIVISSLLPCVFFQMEEAIMT